jgi:hypothetical protein
MPRCKVPEILRSEAYLNVRCNKPAPCFDTGKDERNAADGRFSTACIDLIRH